MQLPDAISRVRDSVVQIQVGILGMGKPPVTIGSGFLVGNPVSVITAKHVVDAVDFGAGQTIIVGYALPDVDTPELQIRASFIGTGAEVVGASADHDLALLRVPDPARLQPSIQIGDKAIGAKPRAATLSTLRPRDGIAIAISGYPLSEPSLVTTSGTLATSFSVGAAGKAQSAERFLGDITANPGNSGGPVYAVSDGAVIGVCVGGRLTRVVEGEGMQTAGLTIIVRAAEVVALLEDNGVSPSASPAGPTRTTVSKRARRRHGR